MLNLVYILLILIFFIVFLVKIVFNFIPYDFILFYYHVKFGPHSFLDLYFFLFDFFYLFFNFIPNYFGWLRI
jgi:hypothetical protein